MKVGSRGNIQEWLYDWVETERNHRHISHLYGLHPSNQITKRGTPPLYTAARRTLELRGDDGTGWSLAWKINYWARMEEGTRAHDLIRLPRHAPPGWRRTCSTCTRRSRSTATSAPPPASPRCCCRATTASCTCCRRCRRPGRAGRCSGLRGRGGYTVGVDVERRSGRRDPRPADRDGTVKVRARFFTGTFTVVDTATVRRPGPPGESDLIEVTGQAGRTYRVTSSGVAAPARREDAGGSFSNVGITSDTDTSVGNFDGGGPALRAGAGPGRRHPGWHRLPRRGQLPLAQRRSGVPTTPSPRGSPSR